MNRIKYLREEKNIYQKDLAKLLDVSIPAINYYENEKRAMDTDTALTLADYFGVSVDYLLGKTDIRHPGQQIDDILNEAMIGMSKEEYENLTETQKKQIRDFAIFVKNQNEEK